MKTYAYAHPGFWALAITLALGACGHVGSDAPAAAAGYRIDVARSSVSYVSTKAAQPGAAGLQELGRFVRFQGGIGEGGQVRLNVDLASVDSGIAIRDERLGKMLFNVAATPQASFEAQLSPQQQAALRSGNAVDLDVEGQFSLGGQARPLKALLRVATLPNGERLVSTRQPLLVSAADHGLAAGVEALRQVAGLHLVTPSAPVSLNLVLTRQP